MYQNKVTQSMQLNNGLFLLLKKKENGLVRVPEPASLIFQMLSTRYGFDPVKLMELLSNEPQGRI